MVALLEYPSGKWAENAGLILRETQDTGVAEPSWERNFWAAYDALSRFDHALYILCGGWAVLMKFRHP